MSVALRASVDEVSSMAEELGLSGLLGLTSPDGKTPSKSGSISPKKVTKETIYKKFDKQWDKASHGVLKDRYESKPHKPPVLDKRDLARLADPIRGRYRSLEEYENKKSSGELEESTDNFSGAGTSAFLTDIGIENRGNASLNVQASAKKGGTFLTEGADGSVSPMKQHNIKKSINASASGQQQRRTVQYSRSAERGFARGAQDSGVSSRNGAVSRLKGKLEEASRYDYRRGRAPQNSVLNNSRNRLSAGIANPRRGAVGQKRFAASTTNLKSVRSSGYGLQNTTGGISNRGRGAIPARNRGNDPAGGAGARRAINPSSNRRNLKRDNANESFSHENANANERRGRVYSRPGVPRLSKQPAGSMRSKSRGRSAAPDENMNRSRGSRKSTERGKVETENRRSNDMRANNHDTSRNRLSRSASRSRQGMSRKAISSRQGASDNKASVDNEKEKGRTRGASLSRGGSAGGGLAAVRERRAGGVPDEGARGAGRDVSFKRLGAKETTISRKRREDALNRSKKGHEDDKIPRTRNSESAPSTVRPAAQSSKKRAGDNVTEQSSRSRSANSTMKKVPNPNLDPLTANSVVHNVSAKDTSDVLKTLAGVQESEQRRFERAQNNSSLPNSADKEASTSVSQSKGKPSQALSGGPGGRVSKGGKDNGISAVGDSAGSLAAALAAKASKLQAQFQKADSLRSSLQALDEAESVALNLERNGLGMVSGTYEIVPKIAVKAANAMERFSSSQKLNSPTKKKFDSSTSATIPQSNTWDTNQLQKSIDEEKLRLLIESDRGLDGLQ